LRVVKPMTPASQKLLSADQIEAFYHDEFVEDQVRDFVALVPSVSAVGVIVDVGGGCGFFARALSDATGVRARVIDMDPESVSACRALGVDAVQGDALRPEIRGDEEVVCFNLILHHLIASSERKTRALQQAALRPWTGRAKSLVVNEYIYESFVGNLSGRLIYWITNSAWLSWAGRQIARVVPAFKANTFGVGVRFRSHDEWRALFAEAGFDVMDARIGAPEPIAAPLRILLIKTIRRDSFRLEARLV
jgi:hypothetical protein